jgi:hypothetical protein
VKDRAAIAIPTDIEDLIEAVYDAERACPQADLAAHWQATKIRMVKKLQTKEAKAKPVRILPPWDEELLEDFNRELDEDNPEKHKTLQALTRDDELPSLSVVMLTPAEADSLALKAKPDLPAARFLLERSVSLSNYGAVQALLDKDRDDPTPTVWRETPLLRHHKLILLDGAGQQQISDHLFHLHSELGVVITKLSPEET